MAKPVTDPVTMSRLAFIRLLYLQAIDQTRLAEPLNFTSVLTFHDAAELFLVLAVDHLQAPLPKRDPNFLEYWQVLQPTATFTDGVALSGRPGMDRLNRHRNAMKHAGALPSSAAVADVRASATSFLEDNTPAVFAIEFAGIDMADIVARPDTRAKLKSSAVAEAAGDRTEAMALLAEAFNELFGSQVGRRSSFQFGQTVRADPFPRMRSLIQLLSKGLPLPQDRRGAQGMGDKVTRQLQEIVGAVIPMQRGMRVLALGIDYGQYNRFDQLTPKVWGSGPDRRVIVEPGYEPTREEYDDCLQFVISVALRIAELDARNGRPSWRPL